MALPSLIGAVEDVPRLSAAMFTVSYALAMLSSLLGGWLWSATDTVLAAFVPAALAALLTTLLSFSLRANAFAEQAPATETNGVTSLSKSAIS